MKDLTIYLNVKVDEDEMGGPRHEIFDESLYLAVPVEVMLNEDATRDYLVSVATRLVGRALNQIKKEYQPELEVKP